VNRPFLDMRLRIFILSFSTLESACCMQTESDLSAPTIRPSELNHNNVI
jgi:hypothetical protein